jgi:hypothetical protein
LTASAPWHRCLYCSSGVSTATATVVSTLQVLMFILSHRLRKHTCSGVLLE